MLVIDILDDAAFLQVGESEPPSQSPVLFPEPLLIHQQAEAFFEAELAGIGGFQLRVEGIGHSVQFHGVEFFNRLLIQHVGFLFCKIWLLHQGGARIVVMWAAQVFMLWTGLSRLGIEHELAVERALQNGLQALIRAGLELDGPPLRPAEGVPCVREGPSPA
jgi:hypothetical protein